MTDEAIDKAIIKAAKEATRDAVRKAWAAGLPITTADGGWVVRVYPDGRKERVKKIK